MHRGHTAPSGTASTWNVAFSALVEQARGGPGSRIPQCTLRGPSSIGGSPCISQPCLNNGTCEDHIRSYSCTCSPGYEGKTCAMGEAPPIPNPCPKSHTAACSGTRGCPGTGNRDTLISGGSLIPLFRPSLEIRPQVLAASCDPLSGPSSVDISQHRGLSSPSLSPSH